MAEEHGNGRLPAHLLLFDGTCNLCNGMVRFIVKRDRRRRFRFSPLQGPFACQHFPDLAGTAAARRTLVYLRDGKALTRSTGALYIARDLGGAWPLFFAFILVPAPLRDAAYDLVARNRFRWFGRRDSCMVPTPGLRDRFL